ncbi:crustacyanin-A1 subunit-like [Oratosquilla oratoria]|uniref:crustacyanin-A1 subunit-like n=1 Tax=Oratosquilla oratoria TaxID=337810 RepID=UPI003F76F2E8
MLSLTALSVPLTLMLTMVLPTASWAAPATSSSEGPYIHQGRCLTFNRLDQVDYQKFSGKWFEVSSRPNVFHDHRMCVQLEFSVDNDAIVSVKTGVSEEGQKRSVTTTLHPQGTQSPVLEVRFGGTMTTTKTIVDTDYSSFACLYQCRQVSKEEKVEWGFALARQFQDAGSATKKCKKFFEGSGFDVQTLMPTLHPGEACNAPITESFPIGV